MYEALGTIFYSQWLVALIVSALLLGFSELGFRLGLRLNRLGDKPRKEQIGGVQAGILGLLGLLLGFTFSMSVSRYEVRRDLTLKEANAIGTTYLRASFLPDPHHVAVENLLRSYVDARLKFYESGFNGDAILQAEKETAALQKKLWAETVAAGKESPTPLVVSFVNSLNDTIDFDETRLSAMRAKVPAPVWILVLVVSCAGCYATGYAAGASGVRSGFANLLLPLLIMIVITIISDFDRPRRGMINISQQPLLDLKESISSP